MENVLRENVVSKNVVSWNIASKSELCKNVESMNSDLKTSGKIAQVRT